jgi:hypothetical protein
MASVLLLAGCGDRGRAPYELLPSEQSDALDGGQHLADGGPNTSDGGRVLDPQNPFLGRWACSGNQVASCPSGAGGDEAKFNLSVVTPSAGKVRSTILDEVDTTTGTDYSAFHTVLDWVVSGSVAELAGSQATFVYPGSHGGTWTPTYEAGTWALAAQTLTWKASGSAVYVNGRTERCTFTQLFTCSAE